MYVYWSKTKKNKNKNKNTRKITVIIIHGGGEYNTFRIIVYTPEVEFDGMATRIDAR